MTTSRPVHARHGTHDPRTGTPAGRPLSVRRTTSLDQIRPDGVLGPLQLRGTASDLRTGSDGSSHLLGRAALEVDVDFMQGRLITALCSAPVRPALQALVGASAATGFRARVDAAVPQERADQSLLYQLLDDVPVATLVSGYAVGAAGVANVAPRIGHIVAADICAGWQTGGTIMLGMVQVGGPPTVTGPAEPTPDRDHDDAPTWLVDGTVPPHTMRRLRRTDVWWEGSSVRASSWFRDSHTAGDGHTTVIHEYDVELTVTPGSWQVTSCVATARVLPWVECPAAVGSAGRLVGQTLADLRAHVRSEFTGTSTCTHLNDQLRSLADVPRLAAALPAGPL